MVKKHLKSLTVPVSWPIKRKGNTFIVRPMPGKSFSTSMPILLIFKDMLKICKTSKEVSTLLRDKEVLVDGKRRKSPKYLVGLMDVLAIPATNEYYRMQLSKSMRLELVKITKEQAETKVCKILGKTTVAGGKTQLNLFDGRNIFAADGKYAVGDSIIIKLPGQEIKTHLKLEKGQEAYLIGGSHVGETGKVESVSGKVVKIHTKEDKFDTPKDYVIIVGKTD